MENLSHRTIVATAFIPPLSFSAWIDWDGRSLPSVTVPPPRYSGYSHTAVRYGAVRALQPLTQVWGCIFHPYKGNLAGTNINKRGLVLIMPGVYTGILFLQSVLRLFILSSSHLVIFSGWSSALYSKLNNRPGPWALLKPCFGSLGGM